ncbi:MAG: repeat-like domain, partial [Phycisphaerales bacterium]|nr:repeat-like domain [Phycisphaerales bacterium]
HTRGDGVEEALGTMTRLIEASPAVGVMAGAGELVKLTPTPVVVVAGQTKSEAFVNAASPFVWTRTNLGDFKLGAIAVRDFARLPDGRWIGALTAGGRVYTATTRDLVTWDAPRELPLNGIGNNVEPALIVDGKGVVWLAWFNNRLSLNPRSSGGYQLWLASCADGRTWSAPRAIGADTGGWPMGALHWLRTADGHFRLSWRAASATAVGPSEITKLSAIQMFVPERLWPMDPQVVQEDGGRFHMVLDDRMRGVTYANSEDGRKWSEPVVLVEKIPNGPGMETPALLIDGRRAALIYQVGAESFLRRGLLSELMNMGAPVQIGGGGVARWARVGEEVVGFVGGETPWVLRGKVADVVGR